MIRRIILVAAIIVAGIGGGFFYYRFSSARLHVFKITFLDVGQGDSAFIQLGNGENMLVDCGADRTVLSGLGEALPFYYRTIDYLLISHFDLDHYGGCIDVLKRYKVKRLITNGEIKRSALSVAWQSAVDTEHMSAIIIERTSTLLFGDVRLEFLSPDRSLEIAAKDLESSNNHSMVFRLVGPRSYLFTGDIEERVERAIVRKYCHGASSTTVGCEALRSDILKLPHHGSDTSSSEAFLAAVNPSAIIISVGKNNSFGHPSRRVLKRLERLNVQVFRTDILGSIVIP
ncbi:MAG: hypothetical protein A3I29_01950 [Candidatus Magasanikbacteria bacterium RIFCSPLOWO2_02_FULL_44_11]|uniref:Metallo-beta-lactamase domain-containing protein n=1 Tax=Candidatus Magasanikbacteria bacterium RIFCSPLOWO2_02_FULL_44_11 TaxID=1798689 RepID=A0A1F6N8R8_9BACT|nr:MAG: hypothetical protein A3I29_01950 [Candidatus Magasanikbacteria bacterium RIFCSPLOWO2_02_FULL_44_11]